MSLRETLKNASVSFLKRVNRLDERTNSWLSPFLNIPIILSFKAATALETSEEKEHRLAGIRENELLYAVRKMIYNPSFYMGSEEYKNAALRDFKGDVDVYSTQEMQDFLETDFCKVWGSALVFGNRENNLNFISYYTLRRAGTKDKAGIIKNVEELTKNPDTFGYQVEDSNNISTDEIVQNIEKIKLEREELIKELASTALFVHGIAPQVSGYEGIIKELAFKHTQKNRYDITPDDVLNYAIDNAEEIINTKYGDCEQKTIDNLRKGMAFLKSERDGKSDNLLEIHHDI